MKPLRPLLALLAAGTLLLSACASSGSSDGTYKFNGAQSPPHLITESARKPAKDFSGSLLNGGTFKLTQDAGKITIVNFWGAWCPPCRLETPQFNQIYAAYKTKDVTFVGIDIKEASRDLPKAFVKQYKIQYPIVYDDAGETAIQLGNPPTQGTPFTIILDRQHRVAGVYIGRLAPADLEPMLNTLIAEKAEN